MLGRSLIDDDVVKALESVPMGQPRVAARYRPGRTEIRIVTARGRNEINDSELNVAVVLINPDGNPVAYEPTEHSAATEALVVFGT
jgi:hypothetical protein